MKSTIIFGLLTVFNLSPAQADSKYDLLLHHNFCRENCNLMKFGMDHLNACYKRCDEAKQKAKTKELNPELAGCSKVDANTIDCGHEVYIKSSAINGDTLQKEAKPDRTASPVAPAAKKQ